MKITPIEIKQKTFAVKSFGKGYDKEEVSNFLKLLAEEWEQKMDENKELKIKIGLLDKEVQKLKEVENSLFKTLKTAEDTSENIVKQANKTAELKVREAQIKADVILNDARGQAKAIVQKSQVRSRNTIQEMVDEMKHKEIAFRDLEKYQDIFIVEFRGFMKESLEKLEKYEAKHSILPFNEKIKEAESLLEDRNEFIDQQEVIQEQEKEREMTESSISVETSNIPVEETPTDTSNSFFDNLNS